MAGDERTGSDDQAALSAAYEERTNQLHDARGALAEAVAALTVELTQRRSEAAAFREERDRAVADSLAQREEVDRQRERIGSLEQALGQARETVAAFEQMKVVRWSEPASRFVYRLRARRR